MDVAMVRTRCAFSLCKSILHSDGRLQSTFFFQFVKSANTLRLFISKKNKNKTNILGINVQRYLLGKHSQYPLSVLYSVYYHTNVASVPSGVSACYYSPCICSIGESRHKSNARASPQQRVRKREAQSKSTSAGVL